LNPFVSYNFIRFILYHICFNVEQGILHVLSKLTSAMPRRRSKRLSSSLKESPSKRAKKAVSPEPSSEVNEECLEQHEMDVSVLEENGRRSYLFKTMDP